MHRIVHLESESLIADLRRPAFAHEWVAYPATQPAQVVLRLQGASIAIANKVALPRGVIEALPDLQMIAVSATGTNHVDLAACRERGIVVSNIRGYADHTVPEHVFALLLALSRNLLAWRESLLAGRWPESSQFCLFDHPIRDLHGATLGLVGSGSLGNGVAKLAEAFGMRVLRAERKDAAQVRAGYTAFAEVLREADAISLHCPLTDQTRGLISHAELRSMKRSALLINTARGGIVDETALIQALREGWIAGAGFDVLDVEPPPTGHPLLAPELLSLPNFLLTPHVAWSSRPAMQILADQLIDNIEAFAAGAPRNQVSMSAREEILRRVRAGVGKVDDAEQRRVRAQALLSQPARGPQPAIGSDRVARFQEKALSLSSSAERVAGVADVPGAVARFLSAGGLGTQAVLSPDLAKLDWAGTSLELAVRPALDADSVGISGCFCAIAETGTLMLLSGPATPATISLLPETHIAVVPESRIVATMEDAFALLRAECAYRAASRQFHFRPVADRDIEQTIVLGAHGPCRVHLILTGEST